MTNPHIIVGEPRRCLCGTYGDHPVGCADLLSALERLVQTQDPDAILLCEAVSPLVEDCD